MTNKRPIKSEKVFMKNLVYLMIALSFILSADATANQNEKLYAKCTTVISKIGDADIGSCGSSQIPMKCISESPGEPPMCSPSGKVAFKNGPITVSAEFVNYNAAVWVNAGDGQFFVSKLKQDALLFPNSFEMLIPVRDSNQRVNGKKAFLNCSVYHESDAQRACPKINP